MKILTIIILIYLPTTIVANFFSTQFIQKNDNGKMKVSDNAWLLAAIGLPMTVATIVVWALWVYFTTVPLPIEQDQISTPLQHQNSFRSFLPWKVGISFHAGDLPHQSNFRKILSWRKATQPLHLDLEQGAVNSQGGASEPQSPNTPAVSLDFKKTVKAMLERVIDTMKTSTDDIPVLLVGGGAVLAPNELAGASRVVKPQWSGVANAIGAATARVSGIIDTIESTEAKSAADVMKDISARAIARAVDNGAKEETVEVVEMDHVPLQYIASKSSFIIKAIGDFDFSRTSFGDGAVEAGSIAEDDMTEFAKQPREGSSENQKALDSPDVDIANYKPTHGLRYSGNWWRWISLWTYARLREIMRNGGVVRVISPDDLKDDDLVACGGGKGSPTVSIEKLPGDEMMQSQKELYKYMNTKPAAVSALEIGGGNGLQGMILGASTNMNIPTVDGDWMGRAYPVAWQTTLDVFETKPVFLPSTIFHDPSYRELMVEKAFRAALSQMGSHVACAKGPVSGRNTKNWVVEHTISLSWRIGRAMALSRQSNQTDTVAESIISEVGGDAVTKILFKGKILGVQRTLRMGHVYGEVIIEGGVDGKEKLKIPFKNENILAVKEDVNGSETVLALVPDLICVIDTQNGEAIGTPEYRYGLLVTVLGIVASEKWTSTARGLDIGGLKGFGMDDIEYKSLGTFQKPKSVIDEYSAGDA
ncbi:hypothetical protein BP5796_13202 [Coleophoma crateriformis]|uniref:Hydantoinase A/oxoprolinase domain-containing protein n=1 Tax=Coleophoma crateriformis TaxID=565419 RepID=A0A3D8Q3T8_9HELO|nr:hypothetical protein BP5796_13202 [Coleophoma crateriformis]